MSIKNLPDILTVKQVCEIVGWHPNTVYRKCTSGEIKSFKSGNTRRIRKEAFLDWMDRLERGEVS